MDLKTYLLESLQKVNERNQIPVSEILSVNPKLGEPNGQTEREDCLLALVSFCEENDYDSYLNNAWEKSGIHIRLNFNRFKRQRKGVWDVVGKTTESFLNFLSNVEIFEEDPRIFTQFLSEYEGLI